jgi:CheY-like chemotaxis protein
LGVDAANEADKIDLSRLSVVVGQLGAFGGDEIERQLAILGIEKPRITHDVDRIVRSIDADRADVLLCDMTKNRLRAQELMRSIRNQEAGSNPFLVTIALTGPMNKDEIGGMIDAGPDDVFIGGFTRDNFVRRVSDLAVNRRKFVAVSSYIGPTRRSSNRPGRKTAEEFAVPNPVQSTGSGIDKDVLWKEIASASKALNFRKLDADVQMIRTLVEEIIPDYQVSLVTDDFKRRIVMLQNTVENVHKRAQRLGHGSLISLCEIAGNVVKDVKERPRPPNVRHLRAMPQLVVGFETALHGMPQQTGTA